MRAYLGTTLVCACGVVSAVSGAAAHVSHEGLQEGSVLQPGASRQLADSTYTFDTQTEVSNKPSVKFRGRRRSRQGLT